MPVHEIDEIGTPLLVMLNGLLEQGFWGITNQGASPDTYGDSSADVDPSLWTP